MPMTTAQIRRFRNDAAQRPGWARAMFLGDSWFQYPGQPVDLQKTLRRRFRQTLHWNDSVAGRESSQIKSVIRRARLPLAEFQFDALVLSMGGNDVVGSELAEFVKRADEPQSYGRTAWGIVPPAVRDHVRLSTFEAALDYVVEDYRLVIDMRNREAPRCVIVVHTYDRPWPDGTPLKLLGRKAGPWMKPWFDAVGLTDAGGQREVAGWLIDQYARVLTELTSQTPGMRIVDSRGVLTRRAQWKDEIHPNRAGFARLVREAWEPILGNGGLLR